MMVPRQCFLHPLLAVTLNEIFINRVFPLTCMVSKKAISPLIATLLLIAFTVALGVMIMNFGRNIVSDYGGCKSVQLAIDSAPNSVCYQENNNKIGYTLVNLGKTDIASLTLKVTNIKVQGPERIKEFDLEKSKIVAGGHLSQTFPFVKPEAFELQFIPKILVNKKEQSCPEQAIKITELEPCS